MTKVLIVDNYDSFVYNIAQYLGELGAAVTVERNDSPRLDAHLGKADGYIISPGPGHPRNTNRSLEVLSNDGFGRPVLGVCLGHQAIAYSRGGTITRANQVIHGKVYPITHDSDPLFDGVPERFRATRYHSLIVKPETLPGCFTVNAWTDQDEIMGLKHKSYPLWGVQFHPESILTSEGKKILRNFIELGE